MARVKDSAPTLVCIRRYKQLIKFLDKLSTALSLPMSNAQCRGALVSVGRMLNSVVCVFTISNDITDRVLNTLNTMLMNVTQDENKSLMQEELAIIEEIRVDIVRCTAALEASLRTKE